MLCTLNIVKAIEVFNTEIDELTQRLDAIDEKSKNKRHELSEQIASRKKSLAEMEERHPCRVLGSGLWNGFRDFIRGHKP